MTGEVEPMTLQELEAGLASIRQSPTDEGVLRMIVCRPRENERRVLDTAELDLTEGLVGDNWLTRGFRSPKEPARLDMQLNVMNARAIALIAQTGERWSLAGDQLFVDLDLSTSNVQPGTRLVIGSAVIEVTDQPHTGCRKFAARYGQDAVRFVNSPVGRELRLRGLNAQVVKAGTIRVGDAVRRG